MSNAGSHLGNEYNLWEATCGQHLSEQGLWLVAFGTPLNYGTLRDTLGSVEFALKFRLN